MPPFFTLNKTSLKTKARLGTMFLKNPRLTIQTPIFMPVATLGAFKTLTFEDLEEMKYDLILHNAFHLTLRPGMDIIKHFQGMKNLTNWKKGLLTDSGGFQVFSLEKLRKITPNGVYFKDPVRGNTHYFSPKIVIDIQMNIGSDIIMPLDECIKANAPYNEVKKAKNTTTKWAREAKNYIETKDNAPHLFGIVQGGLFKDLRKESLDELTALDFSGYSIGGLSVGEGKESMYDITNYTTNFLPAHKPRYLMGVGLPENLVEGVHLGIDMFDCVIPTRNARHGQAFTHTGKLNFNNAQHRLSDEPIDSLCTCKICKRHSRGYLHHLLKSKEPTVQRFLSYHNLYYLSTLMSDIRLSLKYNLFLDFRKAFYKAYQQDEPYYTF